jgi:hypothetical protein
MFRPVGASFGDGASPTVTLWATDLSLASPTVSRRQVDSDFMKRFLILSLVLFFCASVRGQTGVPFAALERQVKSEGGWGGANQAREFNAERMRLGDQFETALLKYVGTDIERHYWTSAFLTDKGYLRGKTPLPHLSLLLKQQALALLEGKRDQDSLMNVVMLSVTAAVLAERLHLHALAVSYKTAAQSLIDHDPDFGGGFPALSSDERRIYDAIAIAKKTF